MGDLPSQSCGDGSLPILPPAPEPAAAYQFDTSGVVTVDKAAAGIPNPNGLWPFAGIYWGRLSPSTQVAIVAASQARAIPRFCEWPPADVAALMRGVS